MIRNAIKENGKYIDPNTEKAIEGPYDIGYIFGEECNKRKEMHKQAFSNRKEVIEAKNNPNLYQIEDRSSNRGHKYEEKIKINK